MKIVCIFSEFVTRASRAACVQQQVALRRAASLETPACRKILKNNLESHFYLFSFLWQFATAGPAQV
jgi:hypothetical protein